MHKKLSPEQSGEFFCQRSGDFKSPENGLQDLYYKFLVNVKKKKKNLDYSLLFHVEMPSIYSLRLWIYG